MQIANRAVDSSAISGPIFLQNYEEIQRPSYQPDDSDDLCWDGYESIENNLKVIFFKILPPFI